MLSDQDLDIDYLLKRFPDIQGQEINEWKFLAEQQSGNRVQNREIFLQSLKDTLGQEEYQELDPQKLKTGLSKVMAMRVIRFAQWKNPTRDSCWQYEGEEKICERTACLLEAPSSNHLAELMDSLEYAVSMKDYRSLPKQFHNLNVSSAHALMSHEYRPLIWPDYFFLHAGLYLQYVRERSILV